MVKNEIACGALALLLLASCSGPEYSWKRIPVDSHFTGVTAPTADNALEALGSVQNGVYTAPSGRVFEGGVTPAEAEILIGLQPEMKDLKQVVGYVPVAMDRRGKESALCNMVVDCIRQGAAKATGRRVDVAFTNRGGMRVNFVQGPLMMEEVRSLLPFRNNIVTMRVKGSDLRALFAQMGREGFQAVSGARLVYSGRELAGAEVGGQPLDDNRIYTLATIDFLLDGGDNYNIGDIALEGTLKRTDVPYVQPFLDHILELQAQGKPVEGQPDGRITVL